MVALCEPPPRLRREDTKPETPRRAEGSKLSSSGESYDADEEDEDDDEDSCDDESSLPFSFSLSLCQPSTRLSSLSSLAVRDTILSLLSNLLDETMANGNMKHEINNDNKQSHTHTGFVWRNLKPGGTNRKC
jgi:hypothetical protein